MSKKERDIKLQLSPTIMSTKKTKKVLLIRDKLQGRLVTIAKMPNVVVIIFRVNKSTARIS